MAEQYKLHSEPLQVGDPKVIVKWGDHSMLKGSNAAPAGVQVPASPAPRPASGAFQGLLALLR